MFDEEILQEACEESLEGSCNQNVTCQPSNVAISVRSEGLSLFKESRLGVSVVSSFAKTISLSPYFSIDFLSFLMNIPIAHISGLGSRPSRQRGGSRSREYRVRRQGGRWKKNQTGRREQTGGKQQKASFGALQIFP